MTRTQSIEVCGEPPAACAIPAMRTPLVGRSGRDALAQLAAVVPKQPDLIGWRVDSFGGIGDTKLVDRDGPCAERASARGMPILFTRRWRLTELRSAAGRTDAARQDDG